jgi:SOS-response transcriptional repressor LexA
MDKPQYIPMFGPVPSLTTTLLETPENPPDLVVRGYAPYRRYAVQVVDDGLDSFGLELGDFAVFREQRWPNRECQICLVTFGDEVTMRLLEYINNPEVTLRVSGEKIPPLELAPTDFVVIGVLDGVIKAEFAQLAYPEPSFDWTT